MAAEEQEGGRGFRVQDRRRFASSTGEDRIDGAEQQPVESPEPNDLDAGQTAGLGGAYAADDHTHAPISFSGFILGLTTQALMFMGEISHPQGQQQTTDLGAARQTIDLLAMLKEKTKGNLDAAEDAMLENALFDLRIRYVEIAKK
jgi:hypothetical protein